MTTNESYPNRRQVLAAAAVAGLAAPLASAGAARDAPRRDPYIYSFNTSTIRGQNLSIVDEVGIAAKAGYQAIEPWINELER